MQIDAIRMRRVGTESDTHAVVVVEVGFGGTFVEVMQEQVGGCFDHIVGMKRVEALVQTATESLPFKLSNSQ